MIQWGEEVSYDSSYEDTIDIVEKERKICVAVVYMRIPWTSLRKKERFALRLVVEVSVGVCMFRDELDLQVGVFQLGTPRPKLHLPHLSLSLCALLLPARLQR